MQAPMKFLESGGNNSSIGGGYEGVQGTGIFNQISGSMDQESFQKMKSEHSVANQNIQMLKKSLSKAVSETIIDP